MKLRKVGFLLIIFGYICLMAMFLCLLELSYIALPFILLFKGISIIAIGIYLTEKDVNKAVERLFDSLKEVEEHFKKIDEEHQSSVFIFEAITEQTNETLDRMLQYMILKKHFENKVTS